MKSILLGLSVGCAWALALLLGGYAIFRSKNDKRLDAFYISEFRDKAKNRVNDTVETVRARMLKFRRPVENLPIDSILEVNTENAAAVA